MKRRRKKQTKNVYVPSKEELRAVKQFWERETLKHEEDKSKLQS